MSLEPQQPATQLKADALPLPGAGGDLLEALGRSFWNWPHPGVAVAGPAGTIVAMSAGAVALSGWCEEAVGRPLGWLRGDADATSDLLAVATHGLAHDTAWRERPDGSRWWADAVVYPLRSADGSLLGFAELTHDRTAEYLESADREMTDTLFTDALAAGKIAVFRQDTDLRYTWGVSALPNTHVDAESLRGRTDEEILAPEVAAMLMQRKREVLRTRQHARFEFVLHEDGVDVHRDVSLAPLLDSAGTVVGVTGVIVDVTELRRTAEELRRSARRLAEAEILGELGSWERDLGTGTSYWSPGIFSLFGIDAADIAPGLAVFLEFVHPDDRDGVAAVIREAEEVNGSYEIEHRIIRPDGRVRWLRSRAEVLAANDDGPRRIVGTARDVTEAHRAGLALRDAADRIDSPTWQRPDPLAGRLSSRQTEILALVADGLSNQQIASQLFISEATVKWHMRQILRALDVSNRAQAVAKYLRSRPEPDC